MGAGLGFVPLGLAFGALAAQSGLDWWWAGLSATLAFGGSFEFLLIGMVTAAAPLAAIALSAFMVILLVYCLRDLPLPLAHARAVAPLVALAVTVGLHLWRRNALMSILGGTAAHVILASTVFAP